MRFIKLPFLNNKKKGLPPLKPSTLTLSSDREILFANFLLCFFFSKRERKPEKKRWTQEFGPIEEMQATGGQSSWFRFVRNCY